MIYVAEFVFSAAGFAPLFFLFIMEKKLGRKILAGFSIVSITILVMLINMEGKGNPAESGASALSPGVYTTISCVDDEAKSKSGFVCFLRQEGSYFRTVFVDEKLPPKFVKAAGKIVPLE